MKIANETRYSPTVLRTILCMVHRQEATHRKRLPQWNRLTVEVQTGPNITGWGYSAGTTARLYVPADGFDVAQLAAVWRYALWCLYGIGRGDMPDSVLLARPGPMAYVVDRVGVSVNPVPPKKKRKPTRTEKRQTKLERLEARERKWQTKLKRAENALAKIRKEKRYYQRQIKKAADAAEAARPNVKRLLAEMGSDGETTGGDARP